MIRIRKIIDTMINIHTILQKRQEENKIIRCGIVGAGQMGRGLITQMMLMKGIMPAAVAASKAENALKALIYAGVDRFDIIVTDVVSEANAAINKGKHVATENIDLISQMSFVDCVIDATGVPDVGATVAKDAILNHKHVVMLNVEADVVIGPYLKKLAEKNGVIYTGSAGDEPAAVMELYSFAKAIGFDVKVIGKGKNNKLDFACTPETVLEEAQRRKMNPKMLCAFKDGTKTMVELTAMCNSTGFVPDIIGTHGISSDVKDLTNRFKLLKDGGMLHRHGVVEYVNGIAPGVFAVVHSDNEEITYQMDYLLMGPGPMWTLYRPYHLCNLETPLSVARAVIYNEPTIVPIDGLVAECIAVAKRDLRAGEIIDGIGGYTTYGSVAAIEVSDKLGYVPYGLVNEKTKLTKSYKKGEYLTLDGVELDRSALIYRLRKEQDSYYGRELLE